jgi:transcriptional regulator with XRE-family HTH domain
MEKVTRKIKRLRENSNFTQEYMAKELNISQPAYAQLENGNTAITNKKISEIAKVLNVNMAKLLSSDELVLDIKNNTLNDNSSIIKEFNMKNSELYERLLSEKDNTILLLKKTLEKLNL